METRIVIAGEDFDDWNGLLDLVLRSYAYMDGRIDPPTSAKRLTAGSLQEKAGRETLFLAMRAETLAGCLFAAPKRQRCLYIGKLAVDPALQGQGVGKRLMAEARRFAENNGFQSLLLECRIELTELHDFYAGLGFEKVAEHAHAGYDRPTSIEMMCRLKEMP